MSLKTKVKSYSFWVSLASALILILKLIGQKFGFSVDEGLISDLFTSLCAILVITGIIVVPSVNVVDVKTETNKNSIIENLSKEQISYDVVEKIESVENKDNFLKTEEQKQQENPLIINNDVEDNKVVDLINDNHYESEVETKEVDLSNIADVSHKKEQVDEINIENFIDKVCLKRAELNSDIAKFVEFLQNEINEINLKK